MKGIEIKFNQVSNTVGIKNGMLIIDILDNNGDGRLYIGAVDYEKRERLLWYDWDTIKLGDSFTLNLTETNVISSPIRIIEEQEVTPPKTKLEIFREVENRLKKKGLL